MTTDEPALGRGMIRIDVKLVLPSGKVVGTRFDAVTAQVLDDGGFTEEALEQLGYLGRKLIAQTREVEDETGVVTDIHGRVARSQ